MNASPGLTDSFERTQGEINADAAGVSIDDIDFVDYFGTDVTEKFELKGGQYFEYKVLNEGEISELQSSSNSEVIVQRQSGDAKMKVDQAKDRHSLIKKAVVSWVLKRRHKTTGEIVDIPFTNNTRDFEDVINNLNPKVVSELEQAIRKFNPALSGETSSEDIQAQIDNLIEDKKVALKREAGKDVS